MSDAKTAAPANVQIMYVCTCCAQNNPEGCGHYDRTELAVMPDGEWLCEGCFDDSGDNLDWQKMPSPPEYVAVTMPEKIEP
jgi:hypothetical protein